MARSGTFEAGDSESRTEAKRRLERLAEETDLLVRGRVWSGRDVAMWRM